MVVRRTKDRDEERRTVSSLVLGSQTSGHSVIECRGLVVHPVGKTTAIKHVLLHGILSIWGRSNLSRVQVLVIRCELAETGCVKELIELKFQNFVWISL